MAVSKRLRYEILRRDNHACRYCGATAPGVKLNVDHVIPKSLGGADVPTNLVTSCADCNAGKTSSMPNAMPVADVNQETFRQAAELKQATLSDHLWQGGYPPEWGREEIERHAAEGAWTYAWSLASNGGDPGHAQYTEFLHQSATLFDRGHSIAEIVCAAVHAGAHLTPDLTWGLDYRTLRNAPISGEQYSRMYGVREAWLKAWRQRHGDAPDQDLDHEFQGRLVLATREGRTHDQLLRAVRSAAEGRTADVDYFAFHIACDDADEMAGDL